jgi:hypothetical protein
MWERERVGPDEVFEVTSEIVAVEGTEGAVAGGARDVVGLTCPARGVESL